jgi:UDP-N-acetylmuramate dehydrogenase
MIKTSDINIQCDVSLSHLNTFGLPSTAKEFVRINNANDIPDAIGSLDIDDLFVLGGGSNILLPEYLERRVLLMDIGGLSFTPVDDSKVVVKAGAGVNWHDFVTRIVADDIGGIENLALIPGKIGAAPVQNIGAYGVEIKDVLRSVNVYDTQYNVYSTIDAEECQFGYRDSIFKNAEKGRYIITSVEMILKTEGHVLDTSYGNIKEALLENGIDKPGVRDVFNAVVHIRKSKLPDPVELGNAGSFFKNPIVSADKKEALHKIFPDLKYYALQDGTYKIPAGWMIEKCGWKGKVVGNVGCYKNQALVVVNYGGATSSEVQQFIQTIISSVNDEFGILLEAEVRIIKN